jgi:hypothetical protein
MASGLPRLTGGHAAAAASTGPTQDSSLPPLTGGQAATSSSLPPLTGTTPVKSPPPKKTGGHGLLHGIASVVKNGASDVAGAAYNVGAGLYGIGKLEYNAVKHDVQHPNLGQHESLHDFLHGSNNPASHQLGQVEAQMGRNTVSSLSDPNYIKHHPTDTLLNLAALATGGLGAAERIGYAADAARAGETADAAKALLSPLHKPPIPERTLKVGGLEVPGHYSPATGARAVQKIVDTGLAKAAGRGIAVGVGKRELSAEGLLQGRAAKWMARNERVADSIARAPGTQLLKAGRKLAPAELRALRLVAEETPVERRLAAQQLRMAGAKTAAESARHQERIDLTQQAMQHLDLGPGGKPILKPTATKLQYVYRLLKAASTSREHMLDNVGLLDKTAADAAKLKTARVAAGARLEKNGVLVGAEDVSVSPNAIHVGNPVERTKIAGAPKVSSSGTFGHTRKPGSLREATGGAVEHALERNDVTNIVAERHAEAVRLSKLDRVRQKLAKAGTAVPRRRNDVFVWTDPLTKNERIPKEVRSYLDNPESIQHLPPEAQTSIREQLRQAVFAQHDWHVDPEARLQFEKIASEGKGVFVPRRLAGQFAKREVDLPGSKFIDAVNNAQKVGLIYLKVNYPVVQGLSNVAMNIIHQGFAAPVRLTQAVKLDHAVGPQIAGVIDDIMGQGAVMQAQLEGSGTVARASQKLAHVMSAGVDTPARRAAFLHEATAAGFGTPEKLTALVTDPANARKLSEVAQRAKEAIVDYGDLGPNERAIIRRLIFVYPWQKGATKYAGHFVRDHPFQAAALENTGEYGTQQANAQLGPVPSYLRGVFDVGGGLVNPSGANFFQTPAQIGTALAGIATGNPAEIGAGQGFLSPAPGLAVGLLTGRDDIGRQLKGNLGARVRDLTVGQTQLSALVNAATHGHSGAVLGGRGPSKTFPGKHDAYWKFLLGGLYPRQYNRAALNQNAAREKVGR